MSQLSLCMIVKNEESVLEKCLESVASIADEIIIADTGSTDRSVSIAQKYTDKIHHFDWIDDFSAARNYVQKFANFKYILTWDADFMLEASSLDFLKKLKKESFHDLHFIAGSEVVETGDNGKAIKTIHVPLIYQKDLFHWESPIHNQLVANDVYQKLQFGYFEKVKVLHLKDRVIKAQRYDQTLTILEKALKSMPHNPRLLFNYGESLLFAKKYSDAAIVFLDYLDRFPNEDKIKRILALEKLLIIYLSLDQAEMARTVIEKFKEQYLANPRFLLIYADITATSDQSEARKYYLKYLESPQTKSTDNYYHDHERYLIHPQFMLAQIFLAEGDHDAAANLLKSVISQSYLQQTQNSAKLLLNNLLNYD